MNVSKILVTALMLGLLTACSLPHSDLKSPCAGADGAPCDRHPVNDWWLNGANQGENS